MIKCLSGFMLSRSDLGCSFELFEIPPDMSPMLPSGTDHERGTAEWHHL